MNDMEETEKLNGGRPHKNRQHSAREQVLMEGGFAKIFCVEN